MTFCAIKGFCDAIRCRDIFDSESINIKSFVVEDWFAHDYPIEYEYEYEYRFTEYDKIQTPQKPERPASPSRGQQCIHSGNAPTTTSAHAIVRPQFKFLDYTFEAARSIASMYSVGNQ